MVDVKILKHKIKLCDRTKLKCTLCERLCKRMKKQLQNGRKIFAWHISDKELLPRMYFKNSQNATVKEGQVGKWEQTFS